MTAWPTATWLVTPEDWHKQAACRGQDGNIWFTPSATAIGQAVAICCTCPVIEQCLDAAIGRDEPTGIWGGLTRAQRLALTRQRERQVPVIRRGTPGAWEVRSPVGVAIMDVLKDGLWHTRGELVAAARDAVPDRFSSSDVRYRVSHWLGHARQRGKLDYDGISRWRKP